MVLATGSSLITLAAWAATGSSSKAVAHGAELFHSSGCEHCHRAEAAGGSLGPDLRSVGRTLKPIQIERQIRLGGGAARTADGLADAGKGNMPAFGEILTRDDIADLVAYLKTLRAAHPPPVLPSVP